MPPKCNSCGLMHVGSCKKLADKTTVSDTHTITYVTLKPFTTRLPAHLIDLIEAEHKESGRPIQRIVSDILSAHYAESIGK